MKTLLSLSFIVLLIITVTFCIHSKKSNTTIEYYNSPIQSAMNLPFSEAVRVGDLVFLSGQLGMDTAKGKLVEGGIINETKQAMKNIKNTLSDINLSMKDIVKCTVMLADIKEWKVFKEPLINREFHSKT